MNLTLTSKFRPFTYDEMVKPLIQYKEVYDKIEQDYSDLAAQTEMWKDMVNQENSPEAYALYKSYSDQLNAAVDDFSRGMNLSNRRALMRMKRDYAKNITPIALAGAAMKESKKYRQDVLAKDNSAIFKSTPTSLDDFLHGKTPDETYVSGDKIITRTAAKAEAVAKSMFSDPQFKQILGKQKYQVMQANGATPEELFKAISQDPDAQPYLASIFKDEWAAVDGDSYGEKEQLAIKNAISTGMYAALAKPTYQFIENGNSMTAAQRASLALDQQKLSISMQQLDLTRQETNAKIEGYKAARGDAPQWTQEALSYYSDGRVYNYAMHGISRDADGYVRFKVKPGQKYVDSNGKTWKSGEQMVIPGNDDSAVTFYRNNMNVLTPIKGNDTAWGKQTNVQDKPNQATDSFDEANANLPD